MRWKKLGQLYCPAPVHPKLLSHAANPLAVLLKDDIYRVFFSGRDIENRSSVGYVDVDVAKREVVYVHDKPIFERGPENCFYSHGVSIGNCYQAGGRRYMMFMGWLCAPDEHWRGQIGRLVLNPDFSLHIEGNEPFMALDATDPISISYPCVLMGPNGVFHMWYGSTVSWDAGNGEMLHVINHAASHDGQHWQRDGLAVPYRLGTAQVFSRPAVVASSNEGYQMWFSYRGGAGTRYRIGYSYSQNGDKWELRLNDAGIEPSSSGWDSEMVGYPFVFDHKGERFMLYTGNGYGRTGFGLAVLCS